MTTLLICNGELPSKTLCRRLARTSDFIVAADGGANGALKCGITPDVIIGDLDSIASSTRKAFRESEIIKVPRQDNTDFEKALDYLKSKDTGRVRIVGATGMRLDFTIGNLSVLRNYFRDFEVTLLGDHWEAFPVDRRLTMRAPRGTTVSLVPFGRCSGITLKGLKYPLRNASMNVGQIGISNVATQSPFSVSVKRGYMLIVVFDRH